jgi:hypothetical protein
MYSGLVAVSIFILWNALSKFGRRSLGSALVSFGVWLALFCLECMVLGLGGVPKSQ